jgi:acetyl-CoA acetyltransferase family protein
MLKQVYIPYGAYWSSPFCRWQGSLAGEHAIELAARSATQALRTQRIDPEVFDAILLGTSVPQRHAFYGAPWLAGMIGAPGITGPTISQACATSARLVATAAAEIELGARSAVLAVAADRVSNGPHVYYPEPSAPGGRGQSSDWVFEAFEHDPFAKNPMIATAEAVAREAGISRAAQDEITLLRYGQYADALADDRAFQKRYMLPIELGRGKKARVLEADEGIHPTGAESLAKLAPVVTDGTVTYGSQTHPADGNAGMIITGAELAKKLARDPAVTIRLLSFADARVERGRMPKATVWAARRALERAGIAIGDCRAIKTHNPFAVNDVFFCNEFELAPERVNAYGSPLVYGHPQAPTGLRLLIELIEELVIAGGGRGLFSGCAAGDTAMALVIEVG